VAVQRVKQGGQVYDETTTCQMFEAPESGFYVFGVPQFDSAGARVSLQLVRNGGREADGGSNITSWLVPVTVYPFAIDAGVTKLADGWFQANGKLARVSVTNEAAVTRYCMWLDVRDQVWAFPVFSEVPACIGSVAPALEQFAVGLFA